MIINVLSWLTDSVIFNFIFVVSLPLAEMLPNRNSMTVLEPKMLSTYCFFISPRKANSVLQIWRSKQSFCPNFTCISSIVRYFPLRFLLLATFKSLINFNEITMSKDTGQILAETTSMFSHILRLLRCCCARIVFLPAKTKQPSHESWLVYCLRFLIFFSASLLNPHLLP